MKNGPALILSAHPDSSSFGGRLAREVCLSLEGQGGKSIFHDLYQENFPAVLPLEEIRRRASMDPLILEHQEGLALAKEIFLFFPLWWGMPPAILKGWLDRVLAPQVAFAWEGEDFEEKRRIPLLVEKVFHLVITADQKEDPSIISEVWQREIMDFCGSALKLTLIDDLRNREYLPLKEWGQSVLSSS